MRVLLTLALMLYGEAAWAACSTAQLAGQWSLSTDDKICRAFLSIVGDGNVRCIVSFAGDVVGETRIGRIATTLDPNCRFRGTINNHSISGRLNADLSMISGTLSGSGIFVMTRP